MKMGENKNIPESVEPWNIAKSYSGGFVLMPLLECKRMINVSLFGVEDISLQIETPEQIKSINRINAINRLLQELKQMCDNTYHFVKKTNKESLRKLKDELMEVEEVIDGISYNTSDERNNTQETRINEKHFNLCLNKLQKVYMDIRLPLNKLIYPLSDELDLEKFKEEMVRLG